MRFLTDFADQAVILPLVVTIGLVLAFQWWRGAVAWMLVTASTFAVMLILKIGLLACSTGSLQTPSGHVAAATVVSGGLAMLLLRWRPSVLPLAILAAIVVGASRLVLRVHSLSEVIVGALVGLVGAIVLLWSAGPVPQELRTGRLIAIAIAIAILLHGSHLPAEAHIRSLAKQAKIVLGC